MRDGRSGKDAKMNRFPMKILLATDGSEDAAQAREAAVDLARKSGSDLHLVHVWHDVPSPYAHAFIRRGPEAPSRRPTSGADGPPTRSSSSVRN